MGAVYLAEHPEIGRRVAIKVLRTDLNTDPELRGRFLNEARAANAIRHPSIIEILDSGTTAQDVAYLVMELLEGESLRQRIQRMGRLPPRQALDLAEQVASALAATHDKGIVHRDLKPDNLFIVVDEHDPKRERVKVLDFGIAKLHPTFSSGGVKTHTGALMGTPMYMSPEQCSGAKEVDHRSDIYSLGAILYEAICGRPPFVSTGFGELVNMHLSVAPPSPRMTVPSLDENVEAIILRALAKAPDDRFASMGEFQAALQVASRNLPGGRDSIEAMADTSVSHPDVRTAAGSGRRRLIRRLMIATATIVAGVGGVVAWRAVETQPVDDVRRPVFRFFNVETLDWIFTTKESLSALDMVPVRDYVPKGTAFWINKYQVPGTEPFYRLRRRNGTHFYTTSVAERKQALQDKLIDEGSVGFIHTTAGNGTVPLFRLYHPARPSHYYTVSASERDQVTKDYGWVSQGIAGYVFAK